MFVLQLNPMTANAESVVPVVRAETEQELLDILKRERVEPYFDGRWHKVFRKGGLLERYNAPNEKMEAWIGVPAIYDMGTRENWAANAVRQYNWTLDEIPLDEGDD